MKKGTKLLIVESPAKIKTLSKFLGEDFVILSTFGHVKDLPSRKIGVSIDNGKVVLEYEPIKDKAKVIKEICAKAKKSEEVYLASDPDREGEIIAWHIGEEIAQVIKDPSKIFRITFNEITKQAVTAAIQNKSTVDMEKVQAQQARRVLDRWVGYEVSPILWRKIRKGLSAGRVQSATLLIVCTREEEIVSFKPVESWSIHGTFSDKKVTIIAELAKIKNKVAKLTNKEEATKVVDALKKESYAVSDITVKKRIKNPVPPFMTSTIQQAAHNILGFSVKKTMMIAQRLYEGVALADKNNPEALITYMRTDSLRLSDTAITAARGFIDKNYGDKYLPSKANVYAKKAAQDAHEAIRPINVDIKPEFAARYLSKDESKLYSLIWKRFVACQMTPAEYSQRIVSIEGGDYLFRITGSTLIFDGFLKVYLVEDEDDKKTVKIPKEIEKGIPLSLDKIDPKQHFTQPPPRYSEATLVKEMEKKGIGRPSTYAATLNTIQKREYVIKDKRRFTPTELGKSVNNMLIKNLPDIINLTFTAQMEEDLDKIAQGNIKRDVVLETFYKKFKEDLVEFGEQKGKEAVQTDLSCSKCKKPLVIRFGRAGEFVGCSAFPECKFTSNFIRSSEGKIELMEPEAPKVSEQKCPKCSKAMVERMGRFGPFLACSGYPECKHIHQETLKMPCPDCKSEVVQRRSKRGAFWGCSGYPKCTFTIFGNVLEEACPDCKSPYLLKTKEKVSCPSKECDYSKASE